MEYFDYQIIPFEVGFYGWQACIILDLIRNAWLIMKRKKEPNYFGNFLYRSFFGFICLAIMHPELDPLGDPLTVWEAKWKIGYQATSFYMLFDPSLNIIRKKHIDYQGKKSGWLDRLPKWQYYTLKVLTLGMLITSLIVIFQ